MDPYHFDTDPTPGSNALIRIHNKNLLDPWPSITYLHAITVLLSTIIAITSLITIPPPAVAPVIVSTPAEFISTPAEIV